MQALLEGNACIMGSPSLPILKMEFNEVFAVRKIRMSKRRRLLEVLHSARALDTTMKTLVLHHGCTSSKINGTPSSMGAYLIALCDHSVAAIRNITPAQKILFQTNIVSKRNLYLHEAGTFPANDVEVNTLLGEIDTCLATIMAL
jgi:hypothetical protein